MRLNEITLEILDTFETFCILRVKEWQEVAKLNYFESDAFDSGNSLFLHRVWQSKPFAKLETYTPYDLYTALFDVFENCEIGKHFLFAAYVFNSWGCPSSNWPKKPDFSANFAQWIKDNEHHFACYDFSFDNFEQAYKEMCWTEHVDEKNQYFF